MEDDRGIDIENECEADKRNIGGRLVLMLMRAGIFVGEVVVAVVGVIVAVAVGVMFWKTLSVTEVECLGVGFGMVGGDIFDLDGDFVAVVLEMETEDLELR